MSDQINTPDQIAAARASLMLKPSRDYAGVQLTTTATLSAAGIAQVLEWSAGLAHVVLPDNVALTLSAGLVLAGHVVYARFFK